MRMIRSRRARGFGIGAAAMSAWVYGCSGLLKDQIGWRLLDDLAEIHDRDRVGNAAHDPKLVTDEEVGQILFLPATARGAAGFAPAPRHRAR